MQLITRFNSDTFRNHPSVIKEWFVTDEEVKKFANLSGFDIGIDVMPTAENIDFQIEENEINFLFYPRSFVFNQSRIF